MGNLYTKENRSSFIDILKGLCILSVICAHCVNIQENAGTVYGNVSDIFSSLGAIGVPVFFVISGYLYKHGEDFGSFVKKKLIRIVLPWFVIGTFVWLYIVLRKGSISFISWFEFLTGYKSYLYYLTVLLLCYILFFKCNLIFICINMMVSLLSLIICCDYYAGFTAWFYLNPYNWVFWFVSGMLLKQFYIKRASGIFKKYYKWLFILSAIAYGTILIITTKNSKSIGYWSRFGVLIEITAAVLFLCLTYSIDKTQNTIIKKCSDVLQYSGKQSLPIYLLHMPVAGIVAGITNYKAFHILIFVRPFIVLGIVLAAIQAISYMLRERNGMLPIIISRMLGITLNESDKSKYK